MVLAIIAELSGSFQQYTGQMSTLQIVLGSLLIAFLILVPTIYYIFFTDLPNSPPRFPILNGIISGKFNFKEMGPLGVVQEGYKAKGEIFRIQVLHQNCTF